MNMNAFSPRFLVPVVAVGLLLSACGGGSDAPEPTPIPATLVVTSATNNTFDGIYASGAVSLSAVEKVNPIGGEPEVCSFRFSGLQKAGGSTMDGDIRYIPGTNSLRVMFVSIGGFEFVSRDTTNAQVDRANNEIDLTAKVLTASTGVASTITVTGSVPMRGARPEGC